MSRMSSPRARGRLGIDRAALLPGVEKGRLLVDEGDEADRHGRALAGEAVREREQGRDPAPVVVGARAAAHRVVVGADQQKPVRPDRTRPGCYEIGAAHALRLEGLSSRPDNLAPAIRFR